VSYLNTKPLVYGFEQGVMKDEVDLVFDYPARVAAMLQNNIIDIGLIPVAVIPSLPEHHIVTDICIGSDGPVGSVCLFSEVPVEEIATVLLDYQSRTSVQLARILLTEFWHSPAMLVNAKADFRQQLHGSTAGVVIGDRALEQRKRSGFIYDLGEAWKQHTGLPFVFAAWVSNKPLDPGFIERFSAANKIGFEHLPEITAAAKFGAYDLMHYYTKCIDYKLDDRKKEGLNLFLKKLAEHRPVAV
jgi:chorismate dehydratase